MDKSAGSSPTRVRSAASRQFQYGYEAAERRLRSPRRILLAWLAGLMLGLAIGSLIHLR